MLDIKFMTNEVPLLIQEIKTLFLKACSVPVTWLLWPRERRNSWQDIIGSFELPRLKLGWKNPCI